jgi:hypothetical protein
MQARSLSGEESFMARVKTPLKAVRARYDLAGRIADLRVEMFGERGRANMARWLGVPQRTWYKYEEGTAIPAQVVLRIIELTSVEPEWLLNGTGPKYRPVRPEERDQGRTPIQEACALLRAALELLEGDRAAESTTAR